MLLLLLQYCTNIALILYLNDNMPGGYNIAQIDLDAIFTCVALFLEKQSPSDLWEPFMFHIIR